MHRTVFITALKEDGERIGSSLVEERLAACVNIIPSITSIYHWQGKIEKAEEVLLILKTKSELVEQLIERAKELHPYDVPEIISLKIEDGNQDYLKWISEETE